MTGERSRQDFDMQVFFDNTPARSTTWQLSSGDRLVRDAIADGFAWAFFLAASIECDSSNGTLELMVLQQEKP